LSIKTGTVKKEDFSNWTVFLKKLKDFNNNMVTVEKDPNYIPVKDEPVKTTVTTPIKAPEKTTKTVKSTTPAKSVPVKKQK
jgi:hypothetical protein